MKRTQAQRILTLLQKLSQQQTICVASLQEEFGESARTIQRDIKLLREHLGSALVTTERGCYRMLPDADFARLLREGRESKKLRRFFEFLTLLDSRSFNFADDTLTDYLSSIKKESKEIYTIFDNPIEMLQKNHFLDDIKYAVKNRRYCNLVYKETERRDLYDVKPLRILYARNNWYLAALTKNYKHNNGFKRFRINFIESFELLPRTFHRDLQALHYIRSMQSLFEDYNVPQYEARIRVDAHIARHFNVKRYLASQKIVEEHPNGDLTISYSINNEMELIPLVRQWIPHIRILSPEPLKQRMRDEIAHYLSMLE